MKEPVWFDRLMADAMHFDQLQQHGGMPGIRDDNALESALARPRNKWAYEPRTDLASLAAAYGYALATSRGFGDGNKRIAFVAMYTFLGLNGFDLVADETEVVALMVELASGALDETALTTWLRAKVTRF